MKMAVIPMTPPSTPKDVKATKSAIHRLNKDVSNIRRDIMRRKVDNVSEARRIAAAKEGKISELTNNLRASPVIKQSQSNKHYKYRMPAKLRKPMRRNQRSRRVPMKRSIQSSIAAQQNRLRQSRTAKPFSVAKKQEPAPKVKRMPRRAPRRGYVRRAPQSGSRSTKQILRRPYKLSRSFRKSAKKSRSPSTRRALQQEAQVQSRNQSVLKNQLSKNKSQIEAGRRTRRADLMRRRAKMAADRKRRWTPTSKNSKRDVRRARRVQRSPSRQTYVIPDRNGKPMRVSKPMYEKYISMRNTQRDKRFAMNKRPTVSRQPVRRPPQGRSNPNANRALSQDRHTQASKLRMDKAKKVSAQNKRMREIMERRRKASMQSQGVSQRRLLMLKNDVSQSRSAAILKAKKLEDHLTEIRAKKQSIASRLSPIKKNISSYNMFKRMGEANLGEIRRNDNLAGNHRDNLQELNKLNHDAASLGTIARRLEQQEMLIKNQHQVLSDQIGAMNANTLHNVNKQNLSETAYLEKCLSDKVLALNQMGNVSGQGIEKAKAIIRQFDKRQLPYEKAKQRIYRELKAHFVPKGGDLLKPNVGELTKAIANSKSMLEKMGKEFSPWGSAELSKLLNKYSVGQIKTMAEVGRLFMNIENNPRAVQDKVTVAQLGQARALGIAATIRNRKSRQLPGITKATSERRAFYEKQRLAEEERLKASQEKVKETQSLAGFFPRTRSAMERMAR